MIGVILALTLILASWGLLDTVNILLDRQFNEVDLTDATAVFGVPVDDARVDAVTSVHGVTVAEPVVTLPATMATIAMAPPIVKIIPGIENIESMKLEKRISFLATTGSATPFIGLFGTVWGIMNAFHRIGVVQAANISVVAPGVSEALVATAAGLAAAIPAVIFYNFFVNWVKRFSTEMDDFSLEYLTIIERNFT